MLLLVTTALAATPSLPAADAALHDALVARFDAHFEHGEADGCLTPLVADLKANWTLFSAEERARMTAVLAPNKADLLDPMPRRRAAAPPSAGVAADSCFGQQKTNRLTSDHFVVEWDDEITSTTAQTFLDALEDGWAVEVEQLGWRAPDFDGTYLMPAYVEAGSYQGAYTTVDYCGQGLAPYIVAYAGSFSSSSWADTMAVHEFNHALQFGYGYAHEFWWWEATATWIEDQVYPDVDWWAYYVTGYTENPWIAMAAYSQRDQDVFYHMYGMAIWAFYLEDWQGGPDIVRQTWEAADGERGTYTFSQEDALEALGIDFDAAYLDFVARTAIMDYAQQSVFPRVDLRDAIQALPATGESESRAAPQGYGQDFWRIDSDAGGAEGDLVIAFSGEEADWGVVLVEYDDGAPIRVESAVLEGGTGEVRLADFGGDDVVLAVTPLTESDDGHTYSFTASLAPKDDAGGEGDDELAAGDDEKVEAAGCGCATPGGVPTTGAGAAATLALGALALRRRRR